MKRKGNIIEMVVDSINLNIAFDKVLGRKKKSTSVRRLKRRQSKILDRLANRIRDGSYTPLEYREFTLIEGGKERLIQSLPLTDRIAIHAIMRPLTKLFTSLLIRDTYSSMEGRGIHDGLNRLKKALSNKSETKYCLKMDVRKFYASIDKTVLIDQLRRKIKDKRMMQVLVNIINAYKGSGLPIGFHSSQFFGNFYLSQLDHMLKHAGDRYYFRYCDDIVILGSNKVFLHEMLHRIKRYDKDCLHMEIKGNYQIFPVSARHIDFLGYATNHTEIRLRKGIKQRAARKLHKLKSRRRRREVIAALWGWAKHANADKLMIKLIGMKKFKDLGIKQRAINGKRKFAGDRVNQTDLINSVIEVYDFEPDVETQNGHKYLVAAKWNGKDIKFFTGSSPIIDALQQCRNDDAFPFEATLKRVSIGKGSSFEFN
ncbi:MAG: RNA-directed DNA polymerase [Rikenellaceae bacterium]